MSKNGTRKLSRIIPQAAAEASPSFMRMETEAISGTDERNAMESLKVSFQFVGESSRHGIDAGRNSKRPHALRGSC